MDREFNDIDTIIIHCAATPNGRADDINDVDLWHKDRGFGRQWDDYKSFNQHLRFVGYHFVIPVSGAIETGRHILEVGAHAKGHNTQSIGVCVMGTDKFTPEQWVSLERVVLFLRTVMNPANAIRIIGHRDVSSKSCPGFDVAAWLENGAPVHEHILGGKA